MRWLDSVTDSMDMNLSKLCEIVKGRAVWHTAVRGVTKLGHNLVTEQQHDSPKKLDVISCTGPQALEPQGKREM